uniref:Uncharacterized protein n=1 Tax=Arundo donax TaxID=35708 RepID=A0A0A9EMJ0_ARUDO
MPWDRCRRGI